MSSPIVSSLSASSSFPDQGPLQNNHLISSINTVALLSIASFGAFFVCTSSFHVMPIVFPIAASLLIGVVLTKSLINSMQSPCFFERNYIPLCHSRVHPCNYRPFIAPTYTVPVFRSSYPIRNFERARPPIRASYVFPQIRQDVVGERGPVHMQPRASFVFPQVRRDRVGERSSF